MAAVFWAVILLAGLSCTSAELGSPAKIEDFPSVVQVENVAATIWLQQCVGSVLTSYHILSAANCFSGVGYNANTRRIRAGTSTRGYGGSVVEVYHVYIHPSYGQGVGNDGDIAVVRLDGSLKLGDTIQQASILGQGIQLPVALPVTLVGWGTTTEGGLIGNNDLYSLELATVYEGKCLHEYQNAEKPEIITENMVCAGLSTIGGRDLDSRDSGAPLFYSGVTVGVVSFGKSYSDDQYPIVSTSVGSYTSWIVETAAL
ncbi:trypsin CFT-1-like [Trichoplusia ni]|uniref:Trypsin CFT-1-like n=1 Tax=Trichoplusia ni TaxID=7111 RepID=A0A7E5W5T3_TRINI|nr:trypsin CFT-1-like [Trichoplusia ni]